MAQYIAKRPPPPRHSFGLRRAEALAAFINALAMLILVSWIAFEAIHRFSNLVTIQGKAVFTVALIGMDINLLVAWLLSQDKTSVNTRAALVHVLGDILGSVAALVSGAVIYFTGWLAIDPILSLVISLLILKSTFSVLRDSCHFLMEGVPHHIDHLQVSADLAAIEGVLSVHDLHVWEVKPGQTVLTGHVKIGNLTQWPEVLGTIKTMLLAKHGIEQVTLQAELPAKEGGD